MAQDSDFMTASTANDCYLNHEPRGAHTITTKQNDAAVMTEEQLDGVSGGPHIRNYGVTAPIQKRRSNRITATTTGRVAGYGEAATDTSGGT